MCSVDQSSSVAGTANGENGAGTLVGVDGHSGLDEACGDRAAAARSAAAACTSSGLDGVADARPLDLRVVHDLDGPVVAGGLVEEDVHHAGAGLDHGHLRLEHDSVDQLGAPPRNQHVDVAARLHQLGGALTAEFVDGLHRLGEADPPRSRASWITSTSTRLVLIAALPPRSTTALPLLSASAAMSTVTLGRAS